MRIVMIVLRWLLFLPIGLVADVATGLLLKFVNSFWGMYEGFGYQIQVGVIPTIAGILVAGTIVPHYKIIITRLVCIVFGSMALLLIGYVFYMKPTIWLPREIWLSLVKTASYIVGAIIAYICAPTVIEYSDEFEAKYPIFATSKKISQ